MSVPQPDIAPLGDRAFTVSFPVADENLVSALVSGFCKTLHGVQGITDIVPAFNKICVHYEPMHLLEQGVDPLAWMQAIRDLPYMPLPMMKAAKHCIPVCYEPAFAPDLSLLAETLSLTVDAIIDLHVRARFRVGMIGFAPGFPYLTGLPTLLQAPRRANPRIRVEPGSVAIAEHMCGIYPRALPGGWHVIGRSPVTLFDMNRASPCLLSAGDVVSFYPITRAQFEDWPC